MRRIGILLAAGACALAAAALLSEGQTQPPAPPPARPTRVGVCDVVVVFNGYERAKHLAAEFDEKAKQIQDEGQRRDQAIKQMNEALDSLVPGSKEYEARLLEVWKTTGEATVWLDMEKRVITRQRLALTEQMYKEVLDAVADIAKERGVDVVIHRDTGKIASKNSVELLNKIALRKCLYASGQVDLTQSVLARANSKYRAGRK